ncbi:MAG: HDIG domain-containing protein [Clostridia bacterium]|nr:HDIG domain-containing protein [Deltaproteobacteria bacterium]
MEKALKTNIRSAHAKRRRWLEARAGTTLEALIAQETESAVPRSATDQWKTSRSELHELSERATRTLRDVCQRYDGHNAIDRTVYPIRDQDVIERETARRVAQSCAKDPTSVRANVRKDARRAGRDAFKSLRLDLPAEPIAALVGALAYRTSYAQNQLEHSIEVGELCGLLALEIGADDIDARRSGLMHDMAKAVARDFDGFAVASASTQRKLPSTDRTHALIGAHESHAVLGAEVAKANRENTTVVNAIAAHHGEVAQKSAVAALLVTADTLSGARLGARRQSLGNFDAMMRDIVTRVQRSAGILSVDVMQAGREVRVMVDKTIADRALEPLAQSIADDLDSTPGLTGHVRVTVIRESRASAIAR